MYKIMKAGKRFNRVTYNTYEAARKHALRIVRKITGPTAWYPTLGDSGFKVCKI